MVIEPLLTFTKSAPPGADALSVAVSPDSSDVEYRTVTGTVVVVESVTVNVTGEPSVADAAAMVTDGIGASSSTMVTVAVHVSPQELPDASTNEKLSKLRLRYI